MAIKILVVDKEGERAMNLVSNLGSEDAELTFIAQTERAIKSVKSKSYDIIVLGDSLDNAGDTYDVGLEIKQSKNRHSPVIAVGLNPTRYTRLVNLLRPYSMHVDVSNKDSVEDCIKHIKNYLSGKTSKKVKK